MSTELGLQVGFCPLTALLSPTSGWYSPTCWNLSQGLCYCSTDEEKAEMGVQATKPLPTGS